MKVDTFVRKDGTTGETYSLAKGDKLVARFSSVRVVPSATISKATGKPVPIQNLSLGVVFPDGKDGFIKITPAQKKMLDKAGDIKGKTIVAYEYENKYGKQTGVKVE